MLELGLSAAPRWERYILYNDLNQLLRVPKNAIQESHSGNQAERPNVAKQKQ